MERATEKGGIIFGYFSSALHYLDKEKLDKIPLKINEGTSGAQLNVFEKK